MNCPECQFENPNDNRFCEGCGARLEKTCSSCGHANRLTARYCGGCGVEIAGDEPRGRAAFAAPGSYTPPHLAERILSSRAAIEGERKRVTVLFADIQGSLALIRGSDPEQVQTLLDAAIRTMMEAVHRYEGVVSKVLGDGVMALFGAPLAHEDHAVRACYAALALQESIRRNSEETRRSHGVELLARVGLNSGEVVVRTIGSDLTMGYDAIGETTHLASRMEQIALPGTIRMARNTLELAEGFVQVKELGPIPIKGLEEAVEAYELTGTTTTRTRFQAALARGLAEFVGRQTEMESLARALQRAGSGDGQVVAIVGEAGVGKSRLFHEFTHSRRIENWLMLESGSVPYGKATAYLPIIDLLKNYFRIEARDDPRQIREKVTGKLLTLDESLRSLMSPFLGLLDVSAEEESWRMLDPTQRRRRTLDAVKTLLHRESIVQPLVLVFEDLHWIDGETQAFLDSLVESLPATRILLLVNYRPEYAHGWGGKTYYTQSRIDPLPAENAQELLSATLGDDAALLPLKNVLIERTSGNPFFLEESMRALIEGGAFVGSPGAYRLATESVEVEIPATVQGVLAARIDRLPGRTKRLLQTAAVVGKDIPYDLLLAAAGTSEDEVRRGLGELQTAEFVYETRLFPDPGYTFKHALTHEVAYQSLLRERRRKLHQAIAEHLEAVSAGVPTKQFERLAHHYTEAGLTGKAVPYWQRAGLRAIERSANAEAVANLTKGLELLSDLPETPERARRELAMQIGLGVGRAAIDWAGTPEVGRAYTRACELCREVGEPGDQVAALWGLWRHKRSATDLARAADLANELSSLGESDGDSASVLQAHHAQWSTRFYFGEFANCCEHTQAAFALYDASKHHAQAFRFGGHDACVCGHSVSALSLCLLGYPDQAITRMESGLSLARELHHPETLASALGEAVNLHLLRREADLATERGAMATEIMREHNFSEYYPTNAFLDGWAEVSGGNLNKGIAAIRDGLAARHSAGITTEEAHAIGHYIELLAEAGEARDGFALVERTIALAHRSGITYWNAELLRIRGLLLLNLPDRQSSEAEADFLRAIEIAREQRAKLLELRAAMDLARFWRSRGEHSQARDLLSPIHGWFTEGFDTADLKSAKALLDDLT